MVFPRGLRGGFRIPVGFRIRQDLFQLPGFLFCLCHGFLRLFQAVLFRPDPLLFLTAPLLFLVQGRAGHAGGLPVRLRVAADLCEITVIVAQVFPDAVLFQDKNLFSEPVDKVPVMADRQDRSRIVRQRFLQHFPAVHVQVIGRFVQQQHVVLPEHQFRQGYTALLPAAQGADRGEYVVSRKQEHAQRAAHLILFHPREPVPDLVQYRLLLMQSGLVLVIIADIHTGSPADTPVIRFLFSGQAAQQRGFSGAVVPDQGNPFPGPDMHLYIPEQGPFPEAFLQSFCLQYVFACTPPGFKPELYRILFLRFFQAFDFLQPFLTAPCQADALFPVETAVHGDYRLLPGDFFLLQLPRFHPGFVNLRPFFDVLRVIAGIGFHRSENQFRHPAAHMVQEITVVADHQHGAPVAVQVFLEPGNALQVQVVGRFVQQQQIRFRQQQPAQAQPGPFPAAEPSGFHLPHFPEFQALQHARNLGTPSVAVLPLKLPGQRVIPPA